MPRVGNPKNRLRHFIREWRLHRGLTQEKLADRLETTKANISRIENLKQGYTQDFLEACAVALRTEATNLINRDPTDPEGIWSLWDQAKPAERRQIVEIAKTLLRTGTSR